MFSMRVFYAILSLMTFTGLNSQPNCNLYSNDCYDACLIATEAGSGQGSKGSQEMFDQAIEVCPGLDYAYFEKAVPYLKRGDFISWKTLIDKAVSLNPTAHLGYRGWCRFQFIRDYQGAIEDFEQLDSLVGYDIGYSVNGDYHLNTALALCYKQIGKKEKAIQILENHVNKPNYDPWLYEFLHLGVLKLDIGDAESAVEALTRQLEVNDYLAETYYYLALAHKELGHSSEYISNIQKAKEFYLDGKKLTDPYTTHVDKIYLKMIADELKIALASE